MAYVGLILILIKLGHFGIDDIGNYKDPHPSEVLNNTYA